LSGEKKEKRGVPLWKSSGQPSCLPGEKGKKTPMLTADTRKKKNWSHWRKNRSPLIKREKKGKEKRGSEEGLLDWR